MHKDHDEQLDPWTVSVIEDVYDVQDAAGKWAKMSSKERRMIRQITELDKDEVTDLVEFFVKARGLAIPAGVAAVEFIGKQWVKSNNEKEK